MRIAIFHFKGSAKEYFKIWMANMFLSVITLGIYSAWAKVRRQRYFYGNTFLEGANFEYHAKPIAILISRIVVFVLFFGVGDIVFRALGLDTEYLLLIMVLLPWAYFRGLIFNARNSSFSGVRIFFDGKLLAIYLIFMIPVTPLILIFFGVYPSVDSVDGNSLFPSSFAVSELIMDSPVFLWMSVIAVIAIIAVVGSLYHWKMHCYKASGHRIGDWSFVYQHGYRPYAKFYFLWATILFATVFVLSTFRENDHIVEKQLVFILLSFVSVFHFRAYFVRLFWSGISLAGGGQFRVSFGTLRLMGLLISNAIARVCSLWLLSPWAQIRQVRFLAEHIFIELDDDVMKNLSTTVSAQKDNALGESFDDFGLDVGLI